MFKIDYRQPEITHDASAFQYWEARLSQEDAYQMTLHDDLIDIFDYPLPCTDAIDYTPDQDDFNLAFHALDKWLFSRKMKDVSVKCSDVKHMLFDVQTYLLEAGIFEHGVDGISCNVMSLSVLRRNKQKGDACIIKQQLSFNEDVYKDIKFADFVHDVSHAMTFCCNVINKDELLCNAAIEHDAVKLSGFFNEDFKTDYAQIQYAKHDSIKHVDAKFTCLNILDESLDNSVFLWQDSSSIAMNKNDENDVLIIKFI